MSIVLKSNIPPITNLEEEIFKLKQKHNAVILAHFYQEDELQGIADFIGDSLDLSRKAASTKADLIVFCGVKFMAEVAKILNPNTRVIIPDMDAGCSLEQSCRPSKFKVFREEYPDHIAITYINCSAEIKALSDIIVTSSNAEHIINQIPKDQKIIFAPDKHLGNYLIKKTGREMVLWDGTCIVHENFSEKELINLKIKHSKAKIIAHPECPENLLSYAEFVGSTRALINFAKDNDGNEFIVLTEPGILYKMQEEAPNSIFYEVPSINQAGCISCSQCPYMRLNTMEKLYIAMKNLEPEIILDTKIAEKAKLSLDRMLKMSEAPNVY